MTGETTAVPTPGRPAKSARLNFRVSQDQKDVLEEAAALSGRSLTEFVLASARSAASDILADRTRFVLTPEQWGAFADALARPPRELPKIAALLSSPSILDAE